jgi:hypothetical protein
LFRFFVFFLLLMLVFFFFVFEFEPPTYQYVNEQAKYLTTITHINTHISLLHTLIQTSHYFTHHIPCQYNRCS